MKQKKFDKKLSLNKLTVVNLNDTTLNNIKGGATLLQDGCTATCDTKGLCCPETIDYTLPGGTGLDCYSFGDNCGHSAETCN